MRSQSNIDLLTVGSIAVVAYCLSNFIHEGLGHGGACLIAGGKAIALTSTFFEYDESKTSLLTQRWIAAGGSLMNLVSGAIALGMLRSSTKASLRYFLWLFSLVSFLHAFGYFLFSGVSEVGDWAKVVEGFEPAILYRLLLIGLGAFLYFYVTPRLLMRYLEPFLGRSESERRSRLRTLSLFPYLVGGSTFLLSGILNPHGFKLVLISSLASSFGGTSLLAWYPMSVMQRPVSETREESLGIPRSLRWILGGLIVLIFFVAILGPGIPRALP